MTKILSCSLLILILFSSCKTISYTENRSGSDDSYLSGSEEKINPWKDRDRSRNSLLYSFSMTFMPYNNTYDLTLMRHQLSYFYTRRSGLGYYGGLGLSISANNEATLNYYTPDEINGYFVSAGITLKILPNTWLAVGAILGYAGKSIYITPEAGLNFITNFIDFNIMAGYDFAMKWSFNDPFFGGYSIRLGIGYVY